MRRTRGDTVLLTGATGFLGHYILAELLDRGWRCTVLLRPPVERSIARLADLLRELGVDAERCIADGSIEPVCGDLPDGLPTIRVDSSAILIHAAAATNFQRNTNGDPERTNVDGTRAVLDWADRLGLRRLHLVVGLVDRAAMTDVKSRVRGWSSAEEALQVEPRAAVVRRIVRDELGVFREAMAGPLDRLVDLARDRRARGVLDRDPTATRVLGRGLIFGVGHAKLGVLKILCEMQFMFLPRTQWHSHQLANPKLVKAV